MHQVVRIAHDDLMRGQAIPLRSLLLGYDSQQPASALDFHWDPVSTTESRML